MTTNDKKTVSLVLGSGGARGLAHIGVIHWLEEHGFKIESISGCSVGAIVGGIYAAGKLDEFESWAESLTKVDIASLLDVSWKKNGLVKGEKVINALIELVGDVMIEDLPIKYTAVGTDIVNEKEIWMNSGRLFDAIRASMSLPLFFTPHKYNGVYLIDGGVLNPVPIAPTFNDKTDFTIAVNLGADRQGVDKSKIEQNSISEKASPVTKRITQFFENLKDTVTEEDDEEWSALDIANLAFDAMQNNIARQKLAAYPADYVIEIASDACGIFDIDEAERMKSLGYEKAEDSLSKLLEHK